MQFAGQKGAMGSRGMMRNHSQRGQNAYDLEEMAEEQGWIARLVHLFRSEDDDVQFKVRFQLNPLFPLLAFAVSACQC